MFSNLRLRLTALYLLAGLMLIIVVGGVSYRLISYYLQSTTDLALEHKMAHEFLALNLALPAELAAAEETWSTNRTRLFPQATVVAGTLDATSHLTYTSELAEEAYDGTLASIFVLPVRSNGEPLAAAGLPSSPFAPDRQAVAAALAHGNNFRTSRLPTGARLRLLTYRLPPGQQMAVLEVGRPLTDQDRVTNQLFLTLLLFGAGSAGIVGLGSWWVAGRSLAPAHRAWEQQQAFVANASHELRTPLTLLRASVEVAQRRFGSLEPDRRAILDQVLAECDHMNRLVEDLLLLSRLDAHYLTMEHTVVLLPDLLAGIRQSVLPWADEHGVQLIVQASPCAAWADPTRLRQVLLILIDNALRYTSAGGTVTLSAYAHHREVKVTICDTGAGIAPEHLPHLFDRFYQANDLPRTSTTGSGLGLSIARALIQAQQGTISISSAPGRGTQLRLSLPAAR